MITRIAPTPSGYLHAGNAVHAALVRTVADRLSAEVALRIDDIDPERTRPEYVRDIFEVLAWLGIDWTIGPRDPEDLRSGWSHGRDPQAWAGELADALERGLPAYACVCSRREAAAGTSGGCPGGCRSRGLALEAGVTALRAHVPTGSMVRVGDVTVDLAAELGDFVVWRREGLPAYQMESLVCDRDLGTTVLIRGADLLPSTAAQFYLAEWFDAAAFRECFVVHHRLLLDPSGVKLSKSSGHGAAPLERTEAMRADIWERADELAREVKYQGPPPDAG